MLIVLGAGALILPIVLYPMSYTMWQALDIAMRPVTVDDFDLLEPVAPDHRSCACSLRGNA